MGKQQGHWGVFDDVEKHLVAITNSYPGNKSRALVKEALNGFRFSQRFYLPEETDLVRNPHNVDLTLPYPITTILTAHKREQKHQKYTPIVLIAKQTEKEIHFFAAEKWQQDGALHSNWFFMPIKMMIKNTPNGHAANFDDSAVLEVGQYQTSMEEARGLFQKIQQAYIKKLLNFLAIVNLHNVNARDIEAPKFLNKKRQLKGKLPLQSYKVLEVDGEVWDSPHISTGEGPGCRSHLRRGHIRHLSTGKNVWVRATMVHGSIPGFVEKEYSVTA